MAIERIAVVRHVGAAQDFSDESAARMRDQVQARSDGQFFNQCDDICDRALGQRSMFKRINMALVRGKECFAQSTPFSLPIFAEAPLSGRRRAMEK